MISTRSLILEAVRQHPDLTTVELIPFCPRRYTHENINATYIGQHLRMLLRQGRVITTSDNPRRWRVKE